MDIHKVITAISLELGQTRVFISPMSPKITEKRKKRERVREREKNDYLQSLVFYSVDKKNKAKETHGRLLRATWFSSRYMDKECANMTRYYTLLTARWEKYF